MNIILTADWHLGRRYHEIDGQLAWPVGREKEIWSTVEEIITYANIHGDLLLLCGDLIEANHFQINEMKKLRDLISSVKVPTYIIGGNHDPLGPESLYFEVSWPSHINFFKDGPKEIKYHQDLNIKIAGVSWMGAWAPEFDLSDVEGADVLLLHGDLNINSSYFLQGESALLNSRIKLIAMGHEHASFVIGNKIVMAGAPEPVRRNEFGEHGLVEVKWTNPLQIMGVPMAKRNIIRKELFFYKDTDVEKTYQELSSLTRDNPKDLLYLNVSAYDKDNRNYHIWKSQIMNTLPIIQWNEIVDRTSGDPLWQRFVGELTDLANQEGLSPQDLDEILRLCAGAWGEKP